MHERTVLRLARWDPEQSAVPVWAVVGKIALLIKEALALFGMAESRGTYSLKHAKTCNPVCSTYLKVGVVHKLVISIAAFECCI